MNVTVKGNVLVIEMPMNVPRPSASGKSLVVASTNGNRVTSATVNGRPITIGLNAYIKPPAEGALEPAGMASSIKQKRS